MKPAGPMVYHITHVNNLPSILRRGGLCCDEVIAGSGGPAVEVGITHIKQGRRQRAVEGHAGLHVGACVPFNFCPRSVMLYLLHRGNHPDVTHTEGQGPLVHLELGLHEVVRWAEREGRCWAFTDVNARASYARFFTSLDDLSALSWSAIETRDWRDPRVKERKQAELLVEGFTPFSLVRRIGGADLPVRRACPRPVHHVYPQPRRSSLGAGRSGLALRGCCKRR